MSDKCMYPDFTPSSRYRCGCRCSDCKKYKQSENKKYNNPQKIKRWRKKNKFHLKVYNKLPHRLAMFAKKNAKRREKIKCILSEEEKRKIDLIYEKCQRITKQTGIPHHVDHIIPLALGGLHHPSNLQILTAEANLKKGCKII